jgi:hypothetical protein
MTIYHPVSDFLYELFTFVKLTEALGKQYEDLLSGEGPGTCPVGHNTAVANLPVMLLNEPARAYPQPVPVPF